MHKQAHEMSVIFKRGKKFLSWRYNWQDLPDLFPDWHVPVVFEVMMHERAQKPDGMAAVDGSKPIDLDAVEWIPLKIPA